MKAGPRRSFQSGYKQVILCLVCLGWARAEQGESNWINFGEGSAVVKPQTVCGEIGKIRGAGNEEQPLVLAGGRNHTNRSLNN